MQNAFLPFAGNEVAKASGIRTVLRSRMRIFQLLIRMKLLLLFTILFCIQGYSKGYGQGIDLSLKEASLEQLFTAIEKQTAFHFIYTKEELAGKKPVSIRVRNAHVEAVLDACLKGQLLSYRIQDRYITIRQSAAGSLQQETAPSPFALLKGRVLSDDGEPLAGATVMVKGSAVAAASNEQGEWELVFDKKEAVLLVSCIGYVPREVPVNGRDYISIKLDKAINTLDETVLIAYGKTTQRFNTGNVSKVSAAEISRQPVSNPLAALQGRVPGLVVTQSSGVAGSAFSIQLRGRTSLDLGLSKNDPLIVIDGIPFEPGNQPSNQLVSAVNNPRSTGEGGLSPLHTLNPADIESIEILKDADATAIYGSRGANGVILISTKKGKAGQTKLNAGVYHGFSKVTRVTPMMNTRQYLAMRREAFANDGIIPTSSNAPDLLVWDTTRYTDLKELLIGGTARSNDVQVSFSGGSSHTQFFAGGGYHTESNVFSPSLADRRASGRLSVQHQSNDRRFTLQVSSSYSSDENQLIRTDLTSYLNLPPNVQLFDSTGGISWQEKGSSFPGLNPLAEFERKYVSVSQNLQTNMAMGYRLLEGLQLRINGGFNHFSNTETFINPKRSLAPSNNSLASSSFGKSSNKSWILEPRADYYFTRNKWRLQLLAGGSLQERKQESELITASNYTNDLLLYSTEAAGNVQVSNSQGQYRYAALFGRAGLQYDNRYLLNVSGRRDGSSRFGPHERFASFAAVGAGWIFSASRFSQAKLKWLSFGKLRFSYGVTGNDQIGDYKYLDLWTNTSFTYQGVPGLRPLSLFNPDYNWERNRKLEGGIELGFWEDRLLLSGSYYRNRSSNQLVNYKLAAQSGFSSVVQNLDALVQNSGVELLAQAKLIKGKLFSWNSSFNLTIPRNKLLSFPGLESSSYATSYVIGMPLSIIKRYRYLGINPATGVYNFEDRNGDGQFNSADIQPLENLDPRFYGGWQHELSYKGVGLTLFLEFKKQVGRNYLYAHRSYFPGSANNQPLYVLNHWQQPGDIAPVQVYTSNSSNPSAGAAALRLFSSNGVYGDASFIRLKNLSVSYACNERLLKKIHFEGLRFFLLAQNLVTITKYKGNDPETQNFYQLPPLRTLAFGLNLNL